MGIHFNGTGSSNQGTRYISPVAGVPNPELLTSANQLPVRNLASGEVCLSSAFSLPPTIHSRPESKAHLSSMLPTPTTGPWCWNSWEPLLWLDIAMSYLFLSSYHFPLIWMKPKYRFSVFAHYWYVDQKEHKQQQQTCVFQRALTQKRDTIQGMNLGNHTKEPHLHWSWFKLGNSRIQAHTLKDDSFGNLASK